MSTLWSALAGGLLGFLLGMRHALEPDHLAAVSTLVAEERGAHRGAWLGAIWGVGHSLSLLCVGMVLAMLETRLPPRLATIFEAGVAVMLIALGVRALWVAATTKGHCHHLPGKHRAEPRPLSWRYGGRPLALGVVHGLAGSGALTALVLASLPSLGSRLAYIALFGMGSILGMALLSGLAGLPLKLIGTSPRAAKWLSAITGGFSTGFGVFIAWPLLFG
jgi:high-affinity nickel-transport protein